MTFTASITRQIEAAHHNGPEYHRCHKNHGHSWIITITFEYSEKSLDAYEWGPDFGDVKNLIDVYDHKDLNSFFEPASAERFAKTLFLDFSREMGFKPKSVQIEEGKGICVVYQEQ